MLKGQTAARIKARIKPFTDPRQTKDHGRPVFFDEAKKCGLKVKLLNHHSPVWRKVWELYLRLNHLTVTSATKVVETSDDNYYSGSGN